MRLHRGKAKNQSLSIAIHNTHNDMRSRNTFYNG